MPDITGDWGRGAEEKADKRMAINPNARVRIKSGWHEAGKEGILHSIITTDRDWAVITWDGDEDPDMHKLEGIEAIPVEPVIEYVKNMHCKAITLRGARGLWLTVPCPNDAKEGDDYTVSFTKGKPEALKKVVAEQ